MVKHSLASCNLTVHFDSHWWAGDITLAGFLTTLLDRIGRFHLNWLVSCHEFDLSIVNLIVVGALGKPFKKLNICLLYLHVFFNFKVSSLLVQTYLFIWPWILSTWVAANFRQACRCLFWSRGFFNVIVCHGLKLQRCKTCFTVDGGAGVPAVYNSQRRLEPWWTIKSHKYLSPISSHLSGTEYLVLI